MNYLSTAQRRPALAAIAYLLVLLLAASTLGVPLARAQEEERDPIGSAIILAAVVGAVVLIANAGSKAIRSELEERGCPVPDFAGLGVLTQCRRRSDYLKAHPETDPRIADLIMRGYFARGMTADEVRASIGPPTKINRTVGAYGVTEQWVYRYSSRSPGDYLYFRNGVLDSWQVSR